MDRAFYLQCIRKEVYSSKSLRNRLFARLLDPSLDAVYLIRSFQYHSSRHNKILSLYYRNLLVRRYGIFIGRNTFIDIGLYLPHPCGIIIGKSVRIGKNCTIFQNVTIGSQNEFGSPKKEQPLIKDSCTFYTGSIIVGSIVVNDNTVVGANSFLNTSTLPNSVYVGSPAHSISRN